MRRMLKGFLAPEATHQLVFDSARALWGAHPPDDDVSLFLLQWTP